MFLVVCGMSWSSTVAAEVEDEWRDEISAEIDSQWVLTCAILVIFMQAGFAMLEAGSVSSKNVQHVVFKNFVDANVGAMMFFLFGYGLAYGNSIGGFMGTTHFAMDGLEQSDYAVWFLQFTFASISATIASGALAGRCKIEAYFVYALVVTGLVYPIVAHWVWTEDG
jgi:Amt family ammonium transporter